MALPAEILLGVYLGVLTGVLPALVSWGLGFVFRYVTGVTIPGFAVVVLGVAIAGINGGLLGLYEEAVRNSPTLLTAAMVVLMMSLYAHNRGDRMGAELPHRLSLRGLRERTLSADVVDLVGGRGRVEVTVAEPVADLEGYPPLPAALRTELAGSTHRLPADLPLSALETRLADRLRSEFDLADVSVRLDEQARATVAAAPPSGGLSRRVPPGKRAVSVDALVPTGLARRDEVRLTGPDLDVVGTVVSARSDRGDGAVADGGADPLPAGETPPNAERAPTTAGGEGRLTVAVDREAADALLSADAARAVVRSRGIRREYELLSLLRASGNRLRRTTVRADGPLDGVTLGGAALRETYGVAVLAARPAAESGGDWQVAPPGDLTLRAGDELFVVGSRAALAGFSEVAA